MAVSSTQDPEHRMLPSGRCGSVENAYHCYITHLKFMGAFQALTVQSKEAELKEVLYVFGLVIGRQELAYDGEIPQASCLRLFQMMFLVF